MRGENGMGADRRQRTTRLQPAREHWRGLVPFAPGTCDADLAAPGTDHPTDRRLTYCITQGWTFCSQHVAHRPRNLQDSSLQDSRRRRWTD